MTDDQRQTQRALREKMRKKAQRRGYIMRRGERGGYTLHPRGANTRTFYGPLSIEAMVHFLAATPRLPSGGIRPDMGSRADLTALHPAT